MDEKARRKISSQYEKVIEEEHEAYKAFYGSIFGRGHIRRRTKRMVQGEFTPSTVRKTIKRYLGARSDLYSTYADTLRTIMKDMGKWDQQRIEKIFGTREAFKTQGYVSEVYAEILDDMTHDIRMMLVVIELLFANDKNIETAQLPEKRMGIKRKQIGLSKSSLPIASAALEVYLRKQVKESAKPLRYVG